MDKELFDDFLRESKQNLEEAKLVLVEYISDPTDTSILPKAGILVDRVFGTAATLNVESISILCQKMKAICYMASQVNNIMLNGIVASTMLSVVDYILDLANSGAGGLFVYDEKIHSDMVHRLDLLNSKFEKNLRKTVAS